MHQAPELSDVYLKLRVWAYFKRLLSAIRTAAAIERVQRTLPAASSHSGPSEREREGSRRQGSAPPSLSRSVTLPPDAKEQLIKQRIEQLRLQREKKDVRRGYSSC